MNVKEGLVRPGAAVPAIGGCFDYTGFAKYFRRLATPVRLDSDGVYYLSFLFRRYGIDYIIQGFEGLDNFLRSFRLYSS